MEKKTEKKAAVKKAGKEIDPKQAKLNALTQALNNIEKDYGRGAIMKLGDENIEPVDVIPSGSIGLNYALGVGGFPRGRIIEIFGPESSGKTTLALHAIAEAQKMGGIAAMIDAEHAFDRFYAEKLGVDVTNLLIAQPDNGEQALEIAEQLIRSSAIDILVIDSVAALTPKSEIEGDMGDKNVGLQARLMSQAMRKLTGTIARTNTVCIFINQLREKIGGMFGTGISRASEIIDLGVEYNIIQKSGSWFSYNGQKLAQGRDAAKAVIDDNPELAEELEAKIMEALNNPELHNTKKSSKSSAGSSSASTGKSAASASKESSDTLYEGEEDDLSDVNLDDELDEDFTLEEE